MSGLPDPAEPRPIEPPPTEPVDEPRQRWRLVVARAPDAPALAQREVAEAWREALEVAALPLVRAATTRSRPRISFGAPLPVGMGAEGELIDVFLADRWPIWRVRDALIGRLPEGWRLVDLFDVWLAGPPLAGRVAAADYRITLASPVPQGSLEKATADVLAADHLPRQRVKGAGTVEYDLRPLIIDLAVEGGPPALIRARTRFHPELGTGRPEEVIGALGDRRGGPLEIGSIVRERLVLVDDLMVGPREAI